MTVLCIQDSFSKAAEKLGYTQSALTQMMHSFEEELGCRLLHRDFSGIRLTAVGEELLPYIDREACDITAEAEESFLQYLYSRTLYRPEGATFSPLTESIRGKTYRIDAPKYFEEITFTFEPDPNKNPSNGGVGHLHFLSNGVRQQIDFGLGTHVCGIFPKYGYHYAATGVWLEEETLLIRISLIDSLVGNALIQCHFCGDRLTVFLQKYAENALAEYTGHLIGYTE